MDLREVFPRKFIQTNTNLFRKLLAMHASFGPEGLVSKRRDRPYQAGRSKHWIKVKNRKHPAMMVECSTRSCPVGRPASPPTQLIKRPFARLCSITGSD